MSASGAIGGWKLESLPPDLRGELFSFVPRHRVAALDPEQLVEVLDAYGRPDLAVSALRALGLPVPTWQPNEPGKLRVLVADESYSALYEAEMEDRYTERGKLAEGGARRLFADLAAREERGA